MNYEFVNAQLMHIEHTETFEVPTNDELANIKEGSFVKVCADYSNIVSHGINSERFWVNVIFVDGDEIHGKVDNDLIGTACHGLSYGDIIKFKKCNVYAIY